MINILDLGNVLKEEMSLQSTDSAKSVSAAK